MRFFILIAFAVGMSSIFLSCQKEDDNFEVYNIIDNRLDLNGSCGIDGDDCGGPGDELLYTFSTSNGNEEVIWSVNGDVTLLSGQGTNAVILKLGSNFSEASVQVESGLCFLEKTIVLCD